MLALVMLLALAILALSLHQKRSPEGYTWPQRQLIPPTSQRDNLRACLAGAVDRGGPAQTGGLTSVPVTAGEVSRRTAAAVAMVNSRCGLDLTQLFVEGGTKQVDGVGNVVWNANVHVFSRRQNAAATIVLSLLEVPGGGRLFLQSARTASQPESFDTSGISPAGPEVFHQRFSEVDTFGGLL